MIWVAAGMFLYACGSGGSSDQAAEQEVSDQMDEESVMDVDAEATEMQESSKENLSEIDSLLNTL
jgi:galactitol-specific phosphotransferase system IIB component